MKLLVLTLSYKSIKSSCMLKKKTDGVQRSLSLRVLPFTLKYKGSLWELFCGSASEVNGSGCYLSLFITVNSSSGSVKLLAFCSLFGSACFVDAEPYHLSANCRRQISFVIRKMVDNLMVFHFLAFWKKLDMFEALYLILCVYEAQKYSLLG